MTLGEEAEGIATQVKLPAGIGFQRARRLIRQALDDVGIADALDAELSSLLLST